MLKSKIKQCLNLVGLSVARYNPSHDTRNVIIAKDYFNKFLEIDIDPKTHDFCIDGFEFIKNLKEKAAAGFSIINNELNVQVRNLNFIIGSWEELLILNEVFVEGVYNFEANDEFIF